MTQYSSVLCFSKLSLFFFFLFFSSSSHVTFNTTPPLHMEAGLKLVIAGYVKVKSLIRTMCCGHYVYFFHVSPHGNQSSQWPTHALRKWGAYSWELTVHSHGMKSYGHEKCCSLRWRLEDWRIRSEVSLLLNCWHFYRKGCVFILPPCFVWKVHTRNVDGHCCSAFMQRHSH